MKDIKMKKKRRKQNNEMRKKIRYDGKGIERGEGGAAEVRGERRRNGGGE